MLEIKEKELNTFFVEVFNDILAKEEKIFNNTEYKDLTIKECHVLEAIAILKKDRNNKMTNIANKINISVGALTTSIKTLLKKGYVKRTICEQDHRIIYINLTSKGEAANAIHEEFHSKMINYIFMSHSKEELQSLVQCLETFKKFFKNI